MSAGADDAAGGSGILAKQLPEVITRMSAHLNLEEVPQQRCRSTGRLNSEGVPQEPALVELLRSSNCFYSPVPRVRSLRSRPWALLCNAVGVEMPPWVTLIRNLFRRLSLAFARRHANAKPPAVAICESAAVPGTGSPAPRRPRRRRSGSRDPPSSRPRT